MAKGLLPFWKSKTSELRKMPTFYFHDNGMRNAIQNDFSPLSTRKDKGELTENLTYNLLRHHLAAENIQYWSTRDLKEVDFILNKQHAIEVKYSDVSVKPSKYKIFRETYPEISFKFACFRNNNKNLHVWAV